MDFKIGQVFKYRFRTSQPYTFMILIEIFTDNNRKFGWFASESNTYRFDLEYVDFSLTEGEFQDWFLPTPEETKSVLNARINYLAVQRQNLFRQECDLTHYLTTFED